MASVCLTIENSIEWYLGGTSGINETNDRDSWFDKII
jgi:hypothetical protein